MPFNNFPNFINVYLLLSGIMRVLLQSYSIPTPFLWSYNYFLVAFEYSVILKK